VAHANLPVLGELPQPLLAQVGHVAVQPLNDHCVLEPGVCGLHFDLAHLARGALDPGPFVLELLLELGARQRREVVAGPDTIAATPLTGQKLIKS